VLNAADGDKPRLSLERCFVLDAAGMRWFN